MKKFAAFLMTLVLMILPLAALAEAPEGCEIYVDPTESYGFMYPSDWILLDKDTVLETLENTDALDDDFAALLEALRPQMEAMEMVMLLHPNGMCNINVVREYTGKQKTIQEIEALMEQFKVLMPQMVSGLEFLTDITPLEMADKEVVMIGYKYETSGVTNAVVQGMLSGEEYLYTITFTFDPADTASGEDGENAMQMIIESAAL